MIERVRRAQSTQIATHDRYIKLKTYKLRNKILLFIKNLKNVKLKKKLLFKFTELFEIIDVIEAQAYKLRLLLF